MYSHSAPSNLNILLYRISTASITIHVAHRSRSQRTIDALVSVLPYCTCTSLHTDLGPKKETAHSSRLGCKRTYQEREHSIVNTILSTGNTTLTPLARERDASQVGQTGTIASHYPLVWYSLLEITLWRGLDSHPPLWTPLQRDESTIVVERSANIRLQDPHV